MAELTEKRKGEHVDIVLKRDVETRTGNGLERYRFLHYSLPELDYGEISLAAAFLGGHKLQAPLMITGMTGGYPEAGRINSDMAEACAAEGIAFALGSQRAMLEYPALKSTFLVKKHPDLFLCGNIGAYQLKKYPPRAIWEMAQAVEADALCVHINPLQELVQPEGDRDWKGVLEMIGQLCDQVNVPVIAKEVGAGINAIVAKELERAGCAAIDVSGTGGTSWSAVEHYRSGQSGDVFRDWGIPTAVALVECSKAVKLPLIAAGGIRTGLDAAKALRLGASIAGAASPFIKAQQAGGENGVREAIRKFKHELRVAMMLTRSKDIPALKKAKLLTE